MDCYGISASAEPRHICLLLERSCTQILHTETIANERQLVSYQHLACVTHILSCVVSELLSGQNTIPDTVPEATETGTISVETIPSTTEPEDSGEMIDHDVDQTLTQILEGDLDKAFADTLEDTQVTLCSEKIVPIYCHSHT